MGVIVYVLMCGGGIEILHLPKTSSFQNCFSKLDIFMQSVLYFEHQLFYSKLCYILEKQLAD